MAAVIDLDLISFASLGDRISVFIGNVFTDVGSPDMNSLWWRGGQDFGIQNKKRKKEICSERLIYRKIIYCLYDV